MNDDLVRPGGQAGLAGYDYQVDVSVWLALCLVLDQRKTSALRLEPESNEDIEATICDEHAPNGTVALEHLDGYTLVVQAKLRTGDAWTEKGLRKLLGHSGRNRRSAVQRLSSSGVRYLLVTSAGLNGVARCLRMRDTASSWPTELPHRIDELLGSVANGRVAVIPEFDWDRLSYKTEALLKGLFQVPHLNTTACVQSLRAEARARMRGAGNGIWARGDLEKLIREHGGFFASSPELEQFVFPLNWDDLKHALDDRHAVLIVGQSGTGKSMTARKLCEHLRKSVPGIEPIQVTRGPIQLDTDRTPPPVLYEIEDPWGKFEASSDSPEWNDVLPGFLGQLRAGDRYVIATCRHDIAMTANALEEVHPWVVRLEVEHYGPSERDQLYASRVNQLPRRLQDTAIRAKAEALSKLDTPLEIQKFFDALRHPPVDKQRQDLVDSAIVLAHRHTIERNVSNQIEKRGDHAAAAVIWGLLKVADAVPQGIITRIEEALSDRYSDMQKGVMSLVHSLIAGRNLRRSNEGDLVSYYHPRVEQGIQSALCNEEKRLLARKVLRRLVSLLASIDRPHDAWSVAASARLLAATKQRSEFTFDPEPEVTHAIDQWLTENVPESASSLLKYLRLAASAGSGDSPMGEVGRFILAWRRVDVVISFDPNEKFPDRDESWYARWRADEHTKPLLERYIVDVLPSDRSGHYETSFVDHLERLAPDLSPAFIYAAKQVVGYGFFFPAHVIATGALRDPDGYEAVVDAAVLEGLSPSRADKFADLSLALANEEFSDDHASFLEGEFDDGHTAAEFIRLYVGHVRSQIGWQRLANHKHRQHLVKHWLDLILQDSGEIRLDPLEVAAAFEVAQGGEDEDRLWYVVQLAWDSRYRYGLGARVVEGDNRIGVRQATLGCLIECALPDLFSVIQRLRRERQFDRLVEIAIDIGEWLESGAGPAYVDHEAAAATAVDGLPADMAGISRARLALRNARVPTLSQGSIRLLQAATQPALDVRRFRVLVDAYVPLNVEGDIRWLVSRADAKECAVDAINAAIRHDMRDVLWESLQHKYAHAAAMALESLGGRLNAPFPTELLATAKAKGSPVRQTLATLLEANPHASHVPTLLQLLADDWSKHSNPYGASQDCPIARTALSALSRTPLDDDVLEEMQNIAFATTDGKLRLDIFRLLARSDNPGWRHCLFGWAVSPGGIEIRRAAARALYLQARQVGPEVLDQIDARIVMQQPAYIAAALTAMFAHSAESDAILVFGQAMAGNLERRVLVLLLIRLIAVRFPETRRRLVEFMPGSHPAVAWAAGDQDARVDLDDGALDDFGDVATCDAVLTYLG